MAGTAVFRIVVSSDSMKKAMATSQGRRRLAAAVGDSASGGAGARIDSEGSISNDCEANVKDSAGHARGAKTLNLSGRHERDTGGSSAASN